MAAPTLTYTLTNGATADATQVMQNFNDLLNGITDATKDLSISALTCAGTATFNGHINLGNSSADDLTVTASLASTIPVKTTNTYDIGSSTKGLAGVYLGANSQTVRIIGSSSMSATWTLTLPTTAGTANYLLKTNGSGVTAWMAHTDSTFAATSSAAGTVTREQNVAEGSISGGSYTTWAGIDTAQFKCVQVGKRVDLWFRLEGAVAGTLTTLNFALPGACPTPDWFSTNGNSEFGIAGTGLVSTAPGTQPVTADVVMYRSAGGDPYIYGYCASISAKLFLGHIAYFVA